MKKTMTATFLAAVMASPLIATVLKDDTFTKNTDGWRPISVDCGKIQRVKEAGQFVLNLDSTAFNGVAKAKFYANNSKQIKFFPGDTFVINVTAKGKGKIISGVFAYKFNLGAPAAIPGGEYELTSEYKTYEFKSSIDAQFRMILPYIELKGNGNAAISKFFMKTVSDDKTSVDLKTTMQVSCAASPAKNIEFETSVKNGNIAISRKMGKEAETKMFKTDEAGRISIPAATLNEGFWEISASAKGKAATAYVDVQDNAVYRATDSLARKLKLADAKHVLFLGCSLTDHYRGYNYVDRVNFWVNKYNPGKFTFRNAGVGGDFCQRMLDRLQGEIRGKNRAWRQEMYKDLFKEKFDMIFIFLGQNDTRSFRKSQFKEQTTPPNIQKKCLNMILAILKERCPGAKIVMISPSPSYIDVMLKHAKRDPHNPNTVLYGQDEFVNLYDKVNREFCKANSIPYVDVLTAMRAMPSRKDLYVEDGIHLAPLGGRVIADEIIKFLGTEYK